MILQFVRGTAESLGRVNPTFRDGQPVFEKDTNRLKIGDGLTAYNDLPYLGGTIAGGTDDTALAAHIASSTPHAVYDDGPSLLLLYQNAKV